MISPAKDRAEDVEEQDGQTSTDGSVTTQETMILPITRRSSEPIPRAIPTPITEPTRMCVVETGIPVREATTTVAAAASSAQKPRVGVSSVMRSPMVAITR